MISIKIKHLTLNQKVNINKKLTYNKKLIIFRLFLLLLKRYTYLYFFKETSLLSKSGGSVQERITKKGSATFEDAVSATGLSIIVSNDFIRYIWSFPYQKDNIIIIWIRQRDTK